MEIYGFEVYGSGFRNEVFGFGLLIWELEFRFWGLVAFHSHLGICWDHTRIVTTLNRKP